MKANFRKLRVEVTFGEFKELDIANDLGNYIHVNTSDIGLDDTARTIYYSKEEIDISDEHASMIIGLIKMDKCTIVAGIKKAIINELNKNKNDQ